MKNRVQADIDRVIQAIRDLPFVSDAKLVGSFAKGKREYKDVDILIALKLTDAELRKVQTPIKRDIVKILKRSAYSNLDLYLHTRDAHEWRLRPWVDDSLPKAERKMIWEWEAWSDWPIELRRGLMRSQRVPTRLLPPQKQQRLQGAYSDKKEQRYSRKPHRGWKKIRYN